MPLPHTCCAAPTRASSTGFWPHSCTGRVAELWHLHHAAEPWTERAELQVPVMGCAFSRKPSPPVTGPKPLSPATVTPLVALGKNRPLRRENWMIERSRATKRQPDTPSDSELNSLSSHVTNGQGGHFSREWQPPEVFWPVTGKCTVRRLKHHAFQSSRPGDCDSRRCRQLSTVTPSAPSDERAPPGLLDSWA